MTAKKNGGGRRAITINGRIVKLKVRIVIGQMEFVAIIDGEMEIEFLIAIADDDDSRQNCNRLKEYRTKVQNMSLKV